MAGGPEIDRGSEVWVPHPSNLRVRLLHYSGFRETGTGGTFSSQLPGTKRLRQIPQVEKHESVVNNLEQRIGLFDFLAY
jgi:hypothetical protein